MTQDSTAEFGPNFTDTIAAIIHDKLDAERTNIERVAARISEYVLSSLASKAAHPVEGERRQIVEWLRDKAGQYVDPQHIAAVIVRRTADQIERGEFLDFGDVPADSATSPATPHVEVEPVAARVVDEERARQIAVDVVYGQLRAASDIAIAILAALTAARAEERERCAKVAENICAEHQESGARVGNVNSPFSGALAHSNFGSAATARKIAAAIRAGGA